MENKEVAKEYMLEDVISKAVQVPGVMVERNKFLAEEFADCCTNLNDLIQKGPVEVGIDRKTLDDISTKLIFKRTSQSSIASFAAGIPGGFALAATIPADILQFFAMALRLAQELSYIYGADDIWKDGKVDDNAVKNQLILYCGVMFGVSGAVSGVRVLSTQVAKTTLKKLPQKALTKTFWYPILKKICTSIGVKMTKKTLASGVSKSVPILGGVISGSLNFASMMPMAKRLKETFDKTCFEYDEDDFNNDIEIITSSSSCEYVKNEKMLDLKSKLFEEINKTKDGVNSITNKIKKHKDDPYEELKKLKDLLDMDIITQDEFDSKKKELLNL